MKRIVTLLIILAVLGGGSYIVYREGTLPVNQKSTESKVFVVPKGANLNSIIDKLYTEDLIRNKLVFYVVVQQLGLERSIQAGSFRLSPSMDAATIARSLTKGTIDTWVTVREGLRKEEVADIMATTMGVSAVEFTQLAEEGYLFPDTYLFAQNSSASAIIAKMERTFAERYTADIAEKARAKGLSQNEVITLASMVEREAAGDTDRETVAAVMLRRIEEGMPLQIDATVQYALGFQQATNSWWKKSLTFDDLKIPSAYNTYANQGLPPGPICNPGLASIQAVVNATADTPYLFYIHDPTGKTHFARTLDEHNSNIEKYLRR